MSRTNPPLRLHPHAWMVDGQEANRRVDEDVIGLPLVATWTEQEKLPGDPERRRTAHADLARWLSGDYTSNNDGR